MELIDWRELYAANRAVIEGREPMALPGGFPAGVGGGGERPAGGGRAGGSVAGLLPAGAPASGPPRVRRAGELVALEHRDGSRVRPVYVYAPPGLDASEPAPLVVMLHGCTQ